MPLRATHLSLADWRSFPSFELALGPSMTVLHGPNAAGKTNVVEALQLLTAGTSFRRPTPAQLVREGEAAARAVATIEGDGRRIDVSLAVAEGRRRFERNGKSVRPADLPQTLMSVLFNPDDLSFVKQGASWRRDEVDAFGRQANKGYARLMHAYARTLEQRNRLLREGCTDRALLAAWDASLAQGGAALLHARARLFERLRVRVSRIYAEVASGEELSCRYVSALADEPAALGREELAERFLDLLDERRPDELRRQQTLVGPQRDDLIFCVDGRDARHFASQGQQRSIVLAWKMAEVELAAEVTGERPLLLLDDVMSELDAHRRAAMTRFVQQGVQTVVTTTNLGYFPRELLERAEVVGIGG